MNMRKIGIFLPSLGGGGAERVMVTLANSFAARGYKVDLILVAAKGPYLKDVSPDVQIVDLKAGRVIRALLLLRDYLKQEQPEVLLSAMTHTNIVALLAHMLGFSQTRLVVSERSTISRSSAQSKGFSARIGYVLLPILYRKAYGICAVSLAAAEDLSRFSGIESDRIKVIYNPFDLRHIAQKATADIDHSWFASRQPPVILGVGRFHESKDFLTLIRAFSRLRARRPARLLILGEGDLRESLESVAKECGLSSDDIQMPGFVENPFPYLARCSVFVLSSRFEGLPGVLIEALACGAPVISTDCPSGPREILEGGRWGKLVPVGDADAMAEAISTVLDASPEQLPDVRQRAAYFDRDKAVDAYLELLGMTPRVE